MLTYEQAYAFALVIQAQWNENWKENFERIHEQRAKGEEPDDLIFCTIDMCPPEFLEIFWSYRGEWRENIGHNYWGAIDGFLLEEDIIALVPDADEGVFDLWTTRDEQQAADLLPLLYKDVIDEFYKGRIL